MSDPRRPCHLIQEDIAWARGLSPEDQKHVLSCSACSETTARFKELDSLVRNVMGADVPSGFADRVVVQIEAEKHREDKRALFENQRGSKSTYRIRQAFRGSSLQFGVFHVY